MPTDELVTIEGTTSFTFKKLIVKRKDTLSGEMVYKKELKPEYQLIFEMVNKVLLPQSKRIFIASIADLVLLEARDSYTSISLRGLMIKHMLKVANIKDGKHGLSYGFLLTRVFENFDMPLEKILWGPRSKCLP